MNKSGVTQVPEELIRLTLTCVLCRGLREDPLDEFELREAAEFDGAGVDEVDIIILKVKCWY